MLNDSFSAIIFQFMDEKCASKTSMVENKKLHRNISIKINESVKLNPITVYYGVGQG